VLILGRCGPGCRSAVGTIFHNAFKLLLDFAKGIVYLVWNVATKKKALIIKPTADEGKKSLAYKVSLPKMHVPLLTTISVVFYLIWIVVGLLILLLIFGNYRQGAFDGLFAPRPSAPAAAEQNIPTETDLPGVGRVNITCVQDSLSAETIQKLVEAGNTSSLTADEKKQLDPCIIDAAEITPSPKS
jgi:hypothetical protein